MYPDLETLITGPDKNKLLEVRRSPRSLLSLLLLFLASVAAIYILTAFLQKPSVQQAMPLVRHFSPRIFAVIPLIILLETLRRLHNDLYIFGQHRLTHFKGRLSFAYNVPVIKYIDMRAINVVQSFWGRVFGFGDISIGTAGHEGNEILIEGVRAPEVLAQLLDQLRTYSLVVTSDERDPRVDTAISD